MALINNQSPFSMKTILSFLITISFSFTVVAQCDIPVPFNGNTGSNMTIMLTQYFLDELNPSDSNSYLVAFNSNGIVVGSTPVYGLTQTTIAIWGDDTQTSEIDGATANENISFQLVDGSNIYSVEMPNAVNYATNSLSVQTSAPLISPYCIYGCTSDWAENFNPQATHDDGACYLNGCTNELACNYSENATIDNGECTLPGCTDNTYTEFYSQGYYAGCDDGSCSKSTADLGITASNFTSPNNTGSNMTLGINLTNTIGLEGSTIAAFYDLNNDGITSECVGLSSYQEGFFSMALWGDDYSTTETEGLSNGATELIFAVLTSSGTVMAFNPNPAFSGYTTNALALITELDFNVTIYGCLDNSYCNYNPEAEEDDGSCLGLPGCIDNDYIEYDASASCTLEGACITTWETAYNSEVELSTQLQSELELVTSNAIIAAEEAQAILEATISEAELAAEIAYQEAQEELNQLLEAANQAELSATNLLNNTIANFELLEEEYMSQIEELAAPIVLDIQEGWNIIGYTLAVEQDVVATFSTISEHILIVKNNAAEVYWPEFGFNGIGNLVPGQGYQLKSSSSIEEYYFPNTQGERIDIYPTVPEWAIDMPVELHPNDIRSLVKVVNLLGQEVNPAEYPKGNTLIYLYNDATVEKKIN